VFDFEKTTYVYALAIVLEKLQIPFEFIDSENLECDLHYFRDRHVDTTKLTVKDIDDIIKLILTW
jgi:hypothetical protein